LKNHQLKKLFLTQILENWWWCGPFALGQYFLPLWHESPKTETRVKYSPFTSSPYGKKHKSEDYTKVGELRGATAKGE
jgi:hypothetical protein